MKFSILSTFLICILFGAVLIVHVSPTIKIVSEEIPEEMKKPDFINVTVSVAKNMIESIRSLKIIDVRTEEEYSKSHIDKAVLIPLAILKDRTNKLDKSEEILIYCKSGKRSASACRILVEKGFASVYNMLGGIEAWEYAGYPVMPSVKGNDKSKKTVICDYCENERDKQIPISHTSARTTSKESKEIAEDELKKIKEKILKKNARWVADETPISKLPFEKRKLLCGTKPVSTSKGGKRLGITPGVIPYGTFDWRNADGINWMTPVKDQGACGSCWAFGTLGSMEAVINIVENDPDIDMDLSEQFLVSCCDECGDCGGGWPSAAYDFIMSNGMPDESCFPYVASNVPCEPCLDWENRAWFISDWSHVLNNSDSIKWALKTYGPLGVAMRAPEDFLFYKSGIYESVWSSPEWDRTFPFGQSNHWITLVGYNDTGEYWIIKNSWGSSWGEEGYGKIAYGVLEKHDYILAILSIEGPTPSAHNLAVSVEAPPYILSGDESLLNATVYNIGLNDETNVELYLLVDGTIISRLEISWLPTGTSRSLSFPWTPTGEGWYNITAYAPPISGEDRLATNIDTEWVYVIGTDKEVLLVVDDDGYSSVYGTSQEEFELALTNLGFEYIVWVESDLGRPSLDIYNMFNFVIWTCGDYWDGAVDSIDAENLISYVSDGGNLLLEGEDIGWEHGSDDFMVNVAHALYQVDYTGAEGLTVTDLDHPVTQGLPTTFNWLIYPPYDDGVTPTNGGYEVIQYTGTDYTAVTVYEGSAEGSVVYYSFPLYCLQESEAETLAINSIRWLLALEHDLIVSLETPLYLKPRAECLLNVTVTNFGLVDESNVAVQLFINGSVALDVVISHLASGVSAAFSHSWTPISGWYNVTAYIQPVLDERFTSNNRASEWVEVSNSPCHIGDIVVEGNNVFRIKDVYFTQTGNIFVRDHARLVVKNATLNLNQTYWRQYQILVNDSAILRTEDAFILSNQYFDVRLEGMAEAWMNSTFFGYSWQDPPTDQIGYIYIEEEVVLNISDSTLPYLYCYDDSNVSVFSSTLRNLSCYDNSSVVISDSDVDWSVYISPWGDAELLLLQSIVENVRIGFSCGSNAYLTELNAGLYGFWNIHVNETVSGVDWNLTLVNTEITQGWELICYCDSVVSVSNSTLRYLYSYHESAVSVVDSDITWGLYVSHWGSSDVSLSGSTVGYPRLGFGRTASPSMILLEQIWDAKQQKIEKEEIRRLEELDDEKGTLWNELYAIAQKYLEENVEQNCLHDPYWIEHILKEQNIFYSSTSEENHSGATSSASVMLTDLNLGLYGFWNIHVNETVIGVDWNLTLVDTKVTQGWELSGYDDSAVSIYNSTLSYLSGYDDSAVSIYNSTLSYLSGYDDSAVSVYNSTLSYLSGYDDSAVSVYNSTIYSLGCYWFTGLLLFDGTLVEDGWWDIYYSQFYLEGDVKFTGVDLWFWNSSVTRNYGIEVRQDDLPASGVALTLSDEYGTPIWSDLTDDYGFADFNLTFADSNYTAIYNLRTDDYQSQREIELTSYTPVILETRIIVTSSWLSEPVTLDGVISSVEEWSDASPLDLKLGLWGSEPPYLDTRAWVKNDGEWLYLLYRVEWPEADHSVDDMGYICYFWGEYTPPWEHSDLGSCSIYGSCLDFYGWDEFNWYLDVEASPEGDNDVEGAGTYDGAYYWLEFRKRIDSGDGYDWNLQYGETYGMRDDHPELGGDLIIGLYDWDTESVYERYIKLDLASPPLQDVSLQGDTAIISRNPFLTDYKLREGVEWDETSWYNETQIEVSGWNGTYYWNGYYELPEGSGTQGIVVIHPLNLTHPRWIAQTVALPDDVDSVLQARICNLARYFGPVTGNDNVFIIKITDLETGAMEELFHDSVNTLDDWIELSFNISHYAGKTVEILVEGYAGGPYSTWDGEYGGVDYFYVESELKLAPVIAVVRGMNNRIYYSVYEDGSSWGGWVKILGKTCDRPAAAILDGELHLVVRGATGKGLYHGRVDLETDMFLGWSKLSGETPSAPALIASSSSLYLVVRGLDDRIYYRSYIDGSWGGWNKFPGKTAMSPTAVVKGDELHLVVIGMNGRLYHGWVDLSTNVFSGWTKMRGMTPSAPVLASSEDSLYLFVRGMNDRIYYNVWDGSWTGCSRLPTGATCDALGAAVQRDSLHIVVRGMTGGLYYGHINLSTHGFSGWTRMSGDTPSPPTLLGD